MVDQDGSFAFRPLEFKLVEIVNQEPIDPSPEALEKNPKAGQLDVDGKKGQTLGWVEEQQKYIVETFDGDLIALKAENLREYEPPPLAEGGFDLAFPSSEYRAESFQSDISDNLVHKKYCVVQMSLKPADSKAAVRSLQELGSWARFMPEFEESYMGQRADGKKVQWFVEDPEAPVEEQMRDTGISAADQQLSSLAIAVCNISPYLGFNGVCRSNGMLHMNCSNWQEEADLLEDARGKAVGAGIIQGHLSFRYRRKICMIYFLNGSGGTLTLHPADRGDNDITLSCREGQVIIFRHDQCDYTYLPEAGQLALQAWIFREQQEGELSISQPELLAYSEAIEDIPKGPTYGNAGTRTDIMSLATRLPGLVCAPEGYWTALSSGFDGVIRIPHARWDHDIYFEPGCEDIPGMNGKAYTQHKGMLDNDRQMMCFDNEFFGIPPEEAIKMDPIARCILEVGYDVLYRAGWTAKSLPGQDIVAVYGTANGEWEGHQLRSINMPIAADTRDMINMGCTAARLHYTFGMQGMSTSIETACSSSLTALAAMHAQMRPDQIGQMKLGGGGKNSDYGFAMGANGHFDPFFLLGLCAAKMLSIQGRCFTFDQTGDGFLRAEATAGMYCKNNDGEDLARLAMLCGSCMNQDGRSASLTAPHGPSQQECIRHSLREAGIPPLLIQMQELHGTGTALGDPIEVGALRATMMMVQGEVREHPLVKTSSKSNVGHTELTAGMCGIIKCVLMGICCTACPNNHIKLLNPHIDTHAYPVYFCSDSVDQGKNEGYLGVSSFGFGGSNARSDIWSRALCGPRNTEPSHARCTLTAERIHVWGEVTRKYGPVAIPNRMDLALENLDEYDDAYLVGDVPGDDDELYCMGTFNAWTAPVKMTFLEDSNAYVFAMPIGESLVEHFQICMNKNQYFKIFPAAKFADQDAPVLGPGMAPKGNVWVIDGRSTESQQGTVYRITLQWDIETKKKLISWEPTLDEVMQDMAMALAPFRHKYHILGSWNIMKPIEMLPAEGEPGTFQVNVKVGFLRHEEFLFQRDADECQAIYPARQRASETDDATAVWTWTGAGIATIADEEDKFGNPKVGDSFKGVHLALMQQKQDMKDFGFDELCGKGLITSAGLQSVPVCGPDHLGGKDKHWMLSGFLGDTASITLRVWEGEIVVTCTTPVTGTRSWTNQQAAMRRKYYVTAAWNNWGYTQMQPDASSVGCHYLRVDIPAKQLMAFQIVVDEDPAQTLHPEMALTDQLRSPALGPDAKGKGLCWGMYLQHGTSVVIRLDPAQEDKRKVVTWSYSTR